MTNKAEGIKVNIYTSITLGIGIAGFIGGIIVKVAGLSIQYGRLCEKMELNEKRDDEERAKSSVKFSELYNRISANESNTNAIKADVNNLMGTCSRIEAKLDRIIERETK